MPARLVELLAIIKKTGSRGGYTAGRLYVEAINTARSIDVEAIVYCYHRHYL